LKKITLLTILAISIIAAPASADREFSFDKKLNFDAEAVNAVRIDMPSGDIKIERSAGAEIELQFKNLVYADSRKKAEKINDRCLYEALIEGDRLVITVDLPRHSKRDFLDKLFSGNWHDDVHLFLRLAIPDGMTVDVKSSSADLEVSNIAVNLDIRGSSSDIEADGVEGNLSCDLSSGDIYVFAHKGDIRIRGKSSDIQVDGVQGNIDIKTSSGDGKLDDVTGSAVVSASSGDYRVIDIGGDLDIYTSSGDIYVDGVAGSVRAETSSGDIQLNALAADEGDFDVNSGSGDVFVELSSGFKGRLSLRSTSGSINSRVAGDIESLSDTKLIASTGDGKGQLNVSTSSGDIRITGY
jgi:hypothetical protein